MKSKEQLGIMFSSLEARSILKAIAIAKAKGGIIMPLVLTIDGVSKNLVFDFSRSYQTWELTLACGVCGVGRELANQERSKDCMYVALGSNGEPKAYNDVTGEELPDAIYQKIMQFEKNIIEDKRCGRCANFLLGRCILSPIKVYASTMMDCAEWRLKT